MTGIAEVEVRSGTYRNDKAHMGKSPLLCIIGVVDSDHDLSPESQNARVEAETHPPGLVAMAKTPEREGGLGPPIPPVPSLVRLKPRVCRRAGIVRHTFHDGGE